MKSDIDVHSYPGWDRELVRTSDELYREHSRDAYASAAHERGKHSASSPSGHLARGTHAVNYDSRNREFGTEAGGGYKAHSRSAYPKHISATEANVDHFRSYIDTSHHGHDGQDFRVTSSEHYHEPPREAYSNSRAESLHLRPGTRAIAYDRNAHTPAPAAREEFPGYWK
jgi:hypothetical protein